MTFHLLPTSRRRFLTSVVAGGLATLICRDGLAAPDQATVHWALLADTHIAADQSAVNSGTNMFDNLNRVIDQILAEDQRPVGAIINGDCAYLFGRLGDYETLRKPLSRLIDGGVSVHITMGNHDDRGPFYQALEAQRPNTTLVEGKHVAVLDAGPVNLYLVDSLQKVNVVSGQIGAEQLSWLDESLRQRSDKPALVFGHHNPNVNAATNGLQDTAEFLEILHAHEHVQAYLFGHTHNWDLSHSEQGLNLINQPPTAYLFNKSRPNGWLRMSVSNAGARLELHALDPQHPQHGEQHWLPWPAAVGN
jgi:metallophosphoesterase superfamily enzyme